MLSKDLRQLDLFRICRHGSIGLHLCSGLSTAWPWPSAGQWGGDASAGQFTPVARSCRIAWRRAGRQGGWAGLGRAGLGLAALKTAKPSLLEIKKSDEESLLPKSWHCQSARTSAHDALVLWHQWRCSCSCKGTCRPLHSIA